MAREVRFLAKMIENDPEIETKRILSIDPSTNSIAFSIFDKSDQSFCGYGKINFPRKSDTSKRCQIINSSLKEVVNHYQIDTVVIEETIYIQNPSTTKILAYTVGSLWGKAVDLGLNVIDVGPMIWKAYIGYKKVTVRDIKVWADELGDKEAKKKASFERKDRVKQIMSSRFPSLELEDYDIWDSIGIGWWAVNNV